MARNEPSTCLYCGCNLTTGDPNDPSFSTRDHVIPKSEQPEINLTVSACRSCNGDKGSMYLSEWVADIKDRLSRFPKGKHLTRLMRLAALHKVGAFEGMWERPS